MSTVRPHNAPAPNLLVGRFSALAPLDDQERKALQLLENKTQHVFQHDTRVLRQGVEIHTPCFIVGGWASAEWQLHDGRRQIVQVLVPGDAIGLNVRARPVSLTHVVARTDLRTVEASGIRSAWRDRSRMPGICAALDLIESEYEFFLLTHMTRLGRQKAYERTANFILELDYRLSARGLCINGSFAFPLTQETLADVLGLSVVHVNRTLQQMRKDGCITLQGGRMTILNREALTTAGDFISPARFMTRAAPSDLPGIV